MVIHIVGLSWCLFPTLSIITEYKMKKKYIANNLPSVKIDNNIHISHLYTGDIN